MGISLVMLAFKEEENLNILIPEIKNILSGFDEEYEIIVVDTEKPQDNTPVVCKKYNVKYINQRYPGFGGAFRTGIESASYDKFLIMDSDGSHSPKYIPDIYREFKTGADIVIGSRYIKGGKNNDSFISLCMSKILNLVYRLVIGVRTRDISTDYRMYDTDQLKRVNLNCKNYDVLQEVIMKMKINNKRLVIKEIPIIFNKRLFGNSKRKLFVFILGYIKTLFVLIKIRICGKVKS